MTRTATSTAVAGDVAVILPYQPGCPHRAEALRWVTRRWTAEQVPSVVGQLPAGQPWVKAAAVHLAMQATDAHIVIVSDADVWCDGWRDAVERVRSDVAWAVPHTHVRRMTLEATQRVYHGSALGGPLVRSVYRGIAGGGMVILRRDLYAQIPLDGRFVGWGQEDEAWGLALGLLGGIGWRGAAPLWHLWHPSARGSVASPYGSKRSEQLIRRYREADRRADPVSAAAAMVRLVGDGHAATLDAIAAR